MDFVSQVTVLPLLLFMSKNYCYELLLSSSILEPKERVHLESITQEQEVFSLKAVGQLNYWKGLSLLIS